MPGSNKDQKYLHTEDTYDGMMIPTQHAGMMTIQSRRLAMLVIVHLLGYLLSSDRRKANISLTNAI